MKVNADKYRLLVTTKDAVSANIEEFVINNSNDEKLLGIKIDTKLSLKIMSHLFAKRLAKNYVHLLQL